MSRIFQIFQYSFSTKNLIRFYLKTGNKNETLYSEIQKRWVKSLKLNNIHTCISVLLSLDDENDIVTPHYIIQVRKTLSEPKTKSYSVAIHTDLTYMMFNVVKQDNKYHAYVVRAITRDFEDYQNLHQNILPSLFMEFIISHVSVLKASDCELSYINKENASILLKGDEKNLCIYSNSLFEGFIPAHDELR